MKTREKLNKLFEEFSEQRIAEILEFYENPERGGKKEKKSFDLQFAEWVEAEKNIKMLYLEDYYEWDKNHWKEITENRILRMAREFLKDRASDSKMSSCYRILRSTCEPLKSTLNKMSVIIPAKNEYLHIDKNGTITYKAPEDKYNFTYFVNAEYNRAKNGKMWQRFLQSSVPNQKTQELLQEFFGYTLQQSLNKQVMLMMTGPGGNGKSTAIEVLEALHYKSVAVDPSRLDGFQIEQMLGSTLCVSSETDKGIQEQNLKKLISGDAVPLDRKNKKIISFKNTSKFVFACNELPHVFDSSEGFWRRMLIMPFYHKPTENDKIDGLSDKIIENELDAVFTWAVEGLQRLIRNNWKFTVSEEVTIKTKAYKTATNSALSYLEEFTFVETTEANTNTVEIYNNYVFYCKENGLKPFSSKKFYTNFNSLIDFDIKKKQKRVLVEVFGEVKKLPKPHMNVNLEYKYESEEADDNLPF